MRTCAKPSSWMPSAKCLTSVVVRSVWGKSAPSCTSPSCFGNRLPDATGRRDAVLGGPCAVHSCHGANDGGARLAGAVVSGTSVDAKPRRGPVTIRDVAALAEVHPSTVSRAMNTATRSRVKEDTVARVLDAAGKLGYRANATARALRLQRSESVGVIVPDLTNPIIPPIVQGIEGRIGDAGYVVLLGNTGHSDERERLYIDAMTANQVGGIISAAAHEGDGALARAMEMGIP